MLQGTESNEDIETYRRIDTGQKHAHNEETQQGTAANSKSSDHDLPTNNSFTTDTSVTASSDQDVFPAVYIWDKKT